MDGIGYDYSYNCGYAALYGGKSDMSVGIKISREKPRLKYDYLFDLRGRSVITMRFATTF